MKVKSANRYKINSTLLTINLTAFTWITQSPYHPPPILYPTLSTYVPHKVKFPHAELAHQYRLYLEEYQQP